MSTHKSLNTKRVVLVPYNWAQLCATTRHMASCDWQKCVNGSCGDILLPITTCHVESCGTNLCPIMWY